MTTPKQKALDKHNTNTFDKNKVVLALAEEHPGIFIRLAERFETEPYITYVPEGVIRLSLIQHKVMLDLLRKGDLIPAIKYVIRTSGTSLRDSKAYVDRFR